MLANPELSFQRPGGGAGQVGLLRVIAQPGRREGPEELQGEVLALLRFYACTIARL